MHQGIPCRQDRTGNVASSQTGLEPEHWEFRMQRECGTEWGPNRSHRGGALAPPNLSRGPENAFPLPHKAFLQGGWGLLSWTLLSTCTPGP